jgi:ssDNA-binding Zn-finger/Zn-ribbon topoisomerase 1
MADKKLNCKDCGSEFAFTEGEQEFYAEKNFPDPVRCPECRKLKKEAKKNGNSQNSN